MKALVQKVGSGEYFAGGAAWSNQKCKAYLFDDAVFAIRFINGMRGVRVLILFKTGSEPVLLFETSE